MRILCVDDDGLVLAVTADLLRALGHEVDEAIGGRPAASAIAAGDPFDLLITDVHMPGGPGGEELARMARAIRPNLPVIFFSGVDQLTASPQDRDRVLRKPCNLGELQQAIAAISPAR